MFLGELISLFVALSWTATALFAEVGSKRMGSLPFNTIRMTMSLFFLILAPAAILFHQKVTVREVIVAVISVVGVCLFFV